MLAWLDRLIAAAVGSLGGILVAIFGVGQLLATSILIRMLLKHVWPAGLATPATVWRLWIVAALLFAFGTAVMALGVWMIRQAFREQKFKL